MASFILWFVVVLILLVAAVLGYYAYVTRRIARQAEALVPPRGRDLDVEGCRIHYIDEGEGRPILFVHGLGGQHHHFRWPLMQAFGSGYRLIAIDRAGSGYSTRGSGMGASLAEQARLVAGVIDALNLERPLVVGHSLGGAIALNLALDFPDKLAGLALIAPLTRHNEDVPPAFRPLFIRSPVLRRLISHTVAVPMAAKAAPQTLAMVFGPQEPPADFAVAGGAFVGMRPSHFYATSTDLVGIGDAMQGLERRYRELKLPVGILFGSADRILDYEKHGLGVREAIPGVEIEIAEGVGHMPQYAVTEQVVAFIRRMAERAFA